MAVSIGGKYEWDFASENGWRIKLKWVREGLAGEEGEPPQPDLYCGEFYRGTEGKPFKVRRVTVGHEWSERYYAKIGEEEGCGGETSGAQAELAKLTEKMQNMHKLSPKEQERLAERYQQLMMKAVEEQQALLARIQDPDFIRKSEEERREFGCRDIHLRLSPGRVDGHVNCGEPIRAINLRGNLKYLGP